MPDRLPAIEFMAAFEDPSCEFLFMGVRPISCEVCVGACCMAGTAMPLDPSEVNFMQNSGTQLVKVEGEGLPPEMGDYQWYGLKDDCANLDPDSRICTRYSERPLICQRFEPALPDCLLIRWARHMPDRPVLKSEPELDQS
jgi:Fe-S-cluster containining protein